VATFRPVEQHLGPLAASVPARAGALAPALARIWDHDHTVFQDDPTEVADRLGWLDCPTRFAGRVGQLATFAEQVAAADLTHAVVVGMGGSSLFPEVLAFSFGGQPGWLEVLVMDSTAPGALRRLDREVPLHRALYVISSKSGTTVETRCQLDFLWSELHAQLGDAAGSRFVAVTDPGSELAEIGRERGFRAVFENPPEIGGRFSALSYFGLVPASLLGIDIGALLTSAREASDACRTPDADSNPALQLAAFLAAAHDAGRDKLTLLLPEQIASFGDWVEQLVAESTGKHGVGLLPVVGESDPADPAVYGDDRVFVAIGERPGLDQLARAGHPVLRLDLDEPTDLGAHLFVWEFATALLGVHLGINPFDQPDVAAAKAATSRVLVEGVPDEEPVHPKELLSQVEPGDYVAIQAFLDPGLEVVEQLEQVRRLLRDELQVPVTLGIGPRYLHSTGQYHKGGPPTGVFLQVVEDDPDELAIPGRDYGFGTLLRAQAAGDLRALRDQGLRAGRVPLQDLLDLVP